MKNKEFDKAILLTTGLLTLPNKITDEIDKKDSYTPIEKAVLAGFKTSADLSTRIKTAYKKYKEKKLEDKLKKTISKTFSIDWNKVSKDPNVAQARNDVVNSYEKLLNVEKSRFDKELIRTKASTADNFTIFMGNYLSGETRIFQFNNKEECLRFLKALDPVHTDFRLYEGNSPEVLNALATSYKYEFNIAKSQFENNITKQNYFNKKFDEWTKTPEGQEGLNIIKRDNDIAIIAGSVLGLTISGLIVTKLMMKKSNHNLKMYAISGALLIGLPIILATILKSVTNLNHERDLERKWQIH